MTDPIDITSRIKARQQLELPHYHSIVCDLSDLSPQDRLSVIAASCDDADLKELFELAVYSLVCEQHQKADRDTIRRVLYGLVDKVIRQAIDGRP